MSSISARNYIREGIRIIELEGNQLEFTGIEIQELLNGIKMKGLFAYLREERPSLYFQILEIYADTVIFPEDKKTVEHLLEQYLLGVGDQLS